MERNQKLSEEMIKICDPKTHIITDGLFRGYKIDTDKKGFLCLKRQNKNGKTTFSVSITEQKSAIDEELLRQYCISEISRKMSEKILDVAYKKFALGQEHKITARDLPVSLKDTPWLFFHAKTVNPERIFRSDTQDADPITILLDSIRDDVIALRKVKIEEIEKETKHKMDEKSENLFVQDVAEAYGQLCGEFLDRTSFAKTAPKTEINFYVPKEK